MEGRHQPQRAEHRITIPHDMIADVSRLYLLSGKGLDLADPGEVVVQRGVEIAQLLLARSKCGPHVLGKAPHGENDQGNGNHAQQRQAPVHAQEHQAYADEHEQVHHHVRYRVRDQPLDQVRVVDGARHQLAGLFVLVEAERQALQVLVDIGANVGDDVPTCHVGHVAPDEAQTPTHDVYCQRQQGQPRDLVHGLGTRFRIGYGGNHVPDNPWSKQLQAHQQDHASHRQCQGNRVRFGIVQHESNSLHRLPSPMAVLANDFVSANV